jgi:hypothetical protein
LSGNLERLKACALEGLRGLSEIFGLSTLRLEREGLSTFSRALSHFHNSRIPESSK